jgi:hypothetical protein
MQSERRESVETPEAPQPCDRRPPLLVLGQAREPLSDRCLASCQAIDSGEQVSEHQLARGLIELLTGKPAAVARGPGRRLGIDPAMTQQHLRDAVASRHQITPARIMGTHQLAGGLDLDWRHHNRR